MSSQHADCLGGVYRVESSIGSIDDHDCDEVGGLILDCPLDGDAACDEDAYYDDFDVAEG